MRSPNPRFLHGPFPVGDMDRPLSSWGYGPAPLRVGDMTPPLFTWRYGLARFRLAPKKYHVKSPKNIAEWEEQGEELKKMAHMKGGH